ncbi:MAG: hypothetical protein ACR2OU_20730, partial [Thermomicrobiales bacterium]
MDQLVQQVQRQQRTRQRWQEAMTRQVARQEEQHLLRAWWQATEKDRPELVQRHREVFARIRRNRIEAHRIERQEREILDAAMRAKGYLVRPGRVFPRYVRPGWKEAKGCTTAARSPTPAVTVSTRPLPQFT